MRGFDGPVVPSRITGALKLILGMLAGAWKLEGRPPGRPGCWLFDCMPGGGPTPGAATSCKSTIHKGSKIAYKSLGEAPCLEAHCSQETLRRMVVAHMAEHLI